MFWEYKKVPDPVDVVIQEQRSSIVDRHEPADANDLSPFCYYMMETNAYRNQIFLIRRHQEVRRFESLGLHRITSVTSHWFIAGCRTTKDIRGL